MKHLKSFVLPSAENKCLKGDPVAWIHLCCELNTDLMVRWFRLLQGSFWFPLPLVAPEV